MAEVKVETEVANPNRSGSEDHQEKKVVVSRVKDGWNGVWAMHPFERVYPYSFANFQALEDEVKDTIRTKWNVQPPHLPESVFDAVTYEIIPAEEYVSSYLAHPRCMGHRRKIYVSVLGWEKFRDMLAKTQCKLVFPPEFYPIRLILQSKTWKGNCSVYLEEMRILLCHLAASFRGVFPHSNAAPIVNPDMEFIAVNPIQGNQSLSCCNCKPYSGQLNSVGHECKPYSGPSSSLGSDCKP